MSETRVRQFHVHDFALAGGTEHANPFLVTVSATFTHASGESIEDIPGFFDGDGTWIVRFCPTRPGAWRGRTSSDDPRLDGVELPELTCVPNENPNVHGRLRVDAARPQRFRWEDGAAFLPLGFECDWLFSLHQSMPDHCREKLDLLVERGFNYVVTNVYAHTGFSDPGHEWVFGPPRLYVFGGTNDEPDHSRLNVAFFRDFDALMGELHRRGVVAHLMIQVQNKHVSWPERRSPADELYWRYVVARYQAFANVVWDVGKESYYFLRELGSHDYTLERIERIRAADAYGHLVTVHDSLGGSPAATSPADDACDFVSDQVHLHDVAKYNREAVRRFRSLGKPYLNIEYGYEQGAEDIKTYRGGTTAPWEDVLLWTWAIYLGGGHACYYYSHTSWDLVKFDPEPAGWRRIQDLAEFLRALDVTAMAPDNELVERGCCLAEPGRRYLAFLPEGGELNIDLAAAGDADGGAAIRCEWMDVFTGDRAEAPVEWKGFATRIGNPLANPRHPCAVAIRVG